MVAELGRAGITVNAPGPGHILTPINDARFPRIIEERTPPHVADKAFRG